MRGQEVKFCQKLNNFDVLNSTIEPWDGPAAICATIANGQLQQPRNGLRPLNTLLLQIIYCCRFETGMVSIQKKIL